MNEPRRRGFFQHLHAERVTERALSPTTTLGFGVATVTLFAVLLVTGVLLMLYFVPAPERAYASMLDIEHVVTLGALTRRLHRFAAHGMVLLVGLHALRVLAMAAYRRRALNWLIGLSLAALTLLFALTGYLLPWDQTAYWATRVVAGMLDWVPFVGAALKLLLIGGDNVGAAALLRCYALHVAVLPVATLALLAWHLWRVRRDGGLARPRPDGAERDGAARDGAAPSVPAWPHLVLRELIFALAIVSVLLVIAAIVPAPLGPPADPLRPDNPEKAPWYFLGLQEAVSYSVYVGAFIFPAAIATLLLLLPLLDRRDEGVGAWLQAPGLRRALLLLVPLALAAGLAVQALTAAGTTVAGDSGWLRALLQPAAVYLVIAAVGLAVGAWRGSARAALTAALLILVLGLLQLTVVGALRGPDWQLQLTTSTPTPTQEAPHGL